MPEKLKYLNQGVGTREDPAVIFIVELAAKIEIMSLPQLTYM